MITSEVPTLRPDTIAGSASRTLTCTMICSGLAPIARAISA